MAVPPVRLPPGGARGVRAAAIWAGARGRGVGDVRAAGKSGGQARTIVRGGRVSALAKAASSSLRGSGVQEKSCRRRKLSLAFCRELLYDRQAVRHGTQSPWGYSSVGRALRSQCRSQGFESPYLHHRVGARFALLRRFFAFGRCIRRKKPPPHRSPAPSVLREGLRLLRLIYDETGARSRRRISFSAPQSAAGAESAARRGGRALRILHMPCGGGGNKGDASSGLFIKSFLVHAAALR